MIKLREDKLSEANESLQRLYTQTPETTGCEYNCSNGICGAHCCKNNTPSLFYSEFRYLWDEFRKSTKEEYIKTVLAAIRNVLSDTLIKGCVFHDPETLKCKTHETRPLVCRVYGVTPKSVWDKRVERVKELNKDHPDKDEYFSKLEQCNLIKTLDGKSEIPIKKEQRFFRRTQDIERSLGIKKQTIDLHDLPGGTYRTMHDHIMLEIFDSDFLTMLSKIKLQRLSEKQIDSILETISSSLEQIWQEQQK